MPVITSLQTGACPLGNTGEYGGDLEQSKSAVTVSVPGTGTLTVARTYSIAPLHDPGVGTATMRRAMLFSPSAWCVSLSSPGLPRSPVHRMIENRLSLWGKSAMRKQRPSTVFPVSSRVLMIRVNW